MSSIIPVFLFHLQSSFTCRVVAICMRGGNCSFFVGGGGGVVVDVVVVVVVVFVFVVVFVSYCCRCRYYSCLSSHWFYHFFPFIETNCNFSYPEIHFPLNRPQNKLSLYPAIFKVSQVGPPNSHSIRNAAVSSRKL